MRLLFVHERFGALGGAEANVLATAAELKRRGHTVGLAHGTPTGREEEAWRETFAEHTTPLGAERAGDSAAAIARSAAAFRPDAIFLHKLGDPRVLTALAEGPVPVVRMVHDHDLTCLRGYKYNPLSRRICTRAASLYCVFPCGACVARGAPGSLLPLRWQSYFAKRRELALNRRFRRLIVATEFMKQELLRNGFHPAQLEVHAPVPRATEPALRASFGLRNRIVYAGQIIRGKGVDVLLESLAKVRVGFECVILGDGSHRAACEALARKLGFGERVRFGGFVPQAQIANTYREASVAVMSSLWPEPFGATGLEAMRCGLPVVAFDAGGIREWLLDGVNGFLVPWMDRARYAEAVEELLRDKSLARRMGERGRAWAAERFGFARYIDGLERLFRHVAQASAPAPIAEPADTAPLLPSVALQS